MKQFGKRLKAERIKLGFTQEDLAKETGKSRLAINNYELGKRSPKIDWLNRLEEAGFDVYHLISGKRVASAVECIIEKHLKEATHREKIIICKTLEYFDFDMSENEALLENLKEITANRTA